MNGRRGITLIEVVAALAILATTAAMVLTAYGESLVQLSTTRTQARAHALARGLLVEWKIEPPNKESMLEGQFPHDAGWTWRRTVVPYRRAHRIAILEVTLRILHRSPQGEFAQVATYTWLERAVDNYSG